jgi:hypothetical protein
MYLIFKLIIYNFYLTTNILHLIFLFIFFYFLKLVSPLCSSHTHVVPIRMTLLYAHFVLGQIFNLCIFQV